MPGRAATGVSKNALVPAGRDRPLLGVLCKLAACLVFALMFASIKWLGPYFPVGEIVFCRALCGLPVIAAAALVRGGPELLQTRRIGSHALRSLTGVGAMFCNFAAYTQLPLAAATAISFAAPLFIVVLAAIMLRERVHLYRWSAVALGFAGVLVIVGPDTGLGSSNLMGSLFALAGAGLTAFAMIALRRMSAHEHSITIAFYFMLISVGIGFVSILWGWNMPSGNEWAILAFTGLSGGVGQLFLSFSYRFSEASILAPFDYTALIWAVALGYFLFGEVPALTMGTGAALVIAAGLLILWRERRNGRRLQETVTV